jgi:putative membrane protein
MRRTTSYLAAIAFGTLMLAACGRREAPPPSPVPPAVIPGPRALPVSTEDYVKVQSSRSLLVVRAAELAAQRSTNSKTLAVAAKLKGDHEGIAAQLSMAGRRLNLLPSPSLLAADQALLDSLASAADFDDTFSRAMKRTVETCSRANASYAANGSSPTLRPVARFIASTCGAELRSL